MMKTIWDILKLGWASHQRWHHFSRPSRILTLIISQWPHKLEDYPLPVSNEEIWRDAKQEKY